jgi:hypothetical protein
MATQYQLVWGDDNFETEHRDALDYVALSAVIKQQRRAAAMTLERYGTAFKSRDEAMARAHRSTAYATAAIGNHF